MVRNLPAKAEEMCSILSQGRSSREGNRNQSSILAREISWTEKAVGYSPQHLKELDVT